MFWMNLLLILAVVIGHTELWVTLINRVHSLPVNEKKLRHLRHVHDLLILLFPVLVFWFVGLTGSALLRGGSLENLHWLWMSIFLICLLGFVGFCWAVLRWQFHQPPAQRISHSSTIVDLARDLGFRPLADGPYEFLVNVPGNNVFQIEFSEHEFLLRNLPSEWDGVTILHITDWHMVGTLQRRFFERVSELCQAEKADLVLFTGDLLDKQSLTEWIPPTLGKLEAPLGKYFILGNHDWQLEPEGIRDSMQEAGWVDVSGEVIEIEHRGSVICMGGLEQPWMGEFPDFSSMPADRFRLLLSHTPDNIPWAKEQQVDLMLSGHNHGGQVVLPVIGPVYSPSKYGVKYAGGIFYEEPTLLSIGRGLSGQHPFRWACRPEVSKLILRSEKLRTSTPREEAASSENSSLPTETSARKAPDKSPR